MKIDAVIEGPEIVTEPRQIEPARTLLEEIYEETRRAQEGRLALPSGRVVEARAERGGDERVTVRSASGEVELEVVMTPRGPLLRFRAADLELAATGEVSVECDRFRVRAESGIVQETAGNFGLRVGGEAAVAVRGDLQTTARSTKIAAERGDVKIEANDDVRLLGERIKLNC